MDLGVKAPGYRRKVTDWLMRWDFYRSGDHVLMPSRGAGHRPRFWLSDEPDAIAQGAGGSVDPEPRRRRVRYVEMGAPSYLESHVRESSASFSDRVSRATHYPLYRHIVDLYVSATLRTEPSRRLKTESGEEVEVGEPWRSYWDDVDLCGDGINSFVRKALTLGLVFDLVFAVTDKPRFDRAAVSRYEAMQRGERPYSYLVSPLDVHNWAFDEQGLVWLQVREDEPVPLAPGVEQDDACKDQYRIWYRDHWELWRNRADRDQSPDWYLHDQDLHPCGEVPVAILWCRRSPETRHSLEADSMLGSIVSIDRTIYNQFSLLMEQVYGQCFTQIWIPGDGTGQALVGLDMGTSVAAEYNGEHGAPLMLAPSADIIRTQWDLIQQQFQLARQSAGVSRGRAEYSKEERSGATLELESQDKNNQIASLAEHCEEFDRRMHWHVALWEGLAKPGQTMDELRGKVPYASYGRDVSLQSVSRRIADVTSISAIPGVPIEVKRALLKPVVTQALREYAVPEDVVQEAQSAIDAMEEPEPPPSPFGGDPEDPDAPPGKPPFKPKPEKQAA